MNGNLKQQVSRFKCIGDLKSTRWEHAKSLPITILMAC
jgi:hypothetical protein